MPAEPASPDDVSSEAAPEIKGAEQSPEPATTSFAAALLAAAKAEGHEVGLSDPVKTEAEPEPEEIVVGDEPPTPPEGQDVKEVDPETEPPKGLSIGEQLAWYKDHDQKSPWYLSRIAEQSATLGKRTERLERAEAKVQELQSELQKAQGPQPTQEQPFADVWDKNELVKLENTYEKILEMSIKYPNGVEGVVTGKNPDGSDKTESFDAEQIADMRYKADKALRKDIPNRQKLLEQRDQLIVATQRSEADALGKYPEFKDPENPMRKEAVELFRANPNLGAVLGPDALLWMARALKGKSLESNGTNGSENDSVNRITQAARTKIAPITTKTRSMPERKGADVAGAKKQLEEKGTMDAAEALVGALLAPRRGTAKKVESLS